MPLPSKELKGSKTLENLQIPYSSTLSDSNPIFAQLGDQKISIKKSNPFSRVNWVAENLLLLVYDPKESSVSVEEQTVGEKDEVTKDEEFVLPPCEKDGKDEDEPLL